MYNKVLIIDDHPVLRFAVRVLMEKEGFEVIGETDNGIDGLKIAREKIPNLVVLDIGIPKLDGLEVIARLQSLRLPLRVLVLTGQPPSLFARRCLNSGAAGFVCKHENLHEVINAAKAVMAGYTYFPSTTLSEMRMGDNAKSDSTLISVLSNRELTVLQLLAQGMSNKDIADSMFLSNKTVSTYKTRLLQKLNATSLVELIDLAKRNNLA
ncbi:virulence factors two-component system response regulator BvgA [Bordetella pertussis CS]|uniref:virulence response regulator transcription factor BvgA n=1 Tax=Bordetella pertussis TaxID=520 RepID=UPI002026AC3D|nr:virulence factors two-component system response regulator BvgA [Bordetella pertussis]URM46820.1 virulence factors two-component system response regulator BvgA [Bordetella pertussis CS]